MIREIIDLRSPLHPSYAKEKIRLNVEGFVQEAVKKKVDKKECLWHLQNGYEADKFVMEKRLEERIDKLTLLRQDKVRSVLAKLKRKLI